MKGTNALRRWAPPGAPWTPWVKAVLFTSADKPYAPGALDDLPDWVGPELIESLARLGQGEGREQHPYRQAARVGEVALVVDLPGALGALAGVALARHGFQPVPLYNALPGARMIVDVEPITKVLLGHARHLPAPGADAAPAFLLDARRFGPQWTVVGGLFDNRSVCFVSDFPSAAKLREAGVRRAVLLQLGGTRPEADVGETLALWQKGGVDIFVKALETHDDPTPCPNPRASWLRRALHRFDNWSFQRHSDNTFGMRISTGG